MVERRDTKIPMISRRVFSVVIWLAVEISAAQPTPQDSDVPIWKREILEGVVNNRPAGVVFLDDQQLIVYVLEPSGQLSSRRSHEISSAYASFADTGRAVRRGKTQQGL
jgi:hypothetical protein